MEQNENDLIKTYLKIEKTEDDVNDLFCLDKNNKIFSLLSLDGKKQILNSIKYLLIMMKILIFMK